MKIVNEHGTECALGEYLRELDIDDLERAKQNVQENIDRIRSQKKIKLIRVGDRWVVERYFALEDFEAAVKYMADRALASYAKEGPHELNLDFCLMYEHEARDTLENWNREAGR